VAPTLATIGGFYGKIFLPGGIVGPIAGVLAGLVWALLIGAITNRLMRRQTWLLEQVSPLICALDRVGDRVPQRVLAYFGGEARLLALRKTWALRAAQSLKSWEVPTACFPNAYAGPPRRDELASGAIPESTKPMTELLK